jgi:hypothetical protein
MGNIGLTEIILMIPGCLLPLGGIAGFVLGIVAFIKVRSLESRVKELERNRGN